jgi:hypothetical protein
MSRTPYLPPNGWCTPSGASLPLHPKKICVKGAHTNFPPFTTGEIPCLAAFPPSRSTSNSLPKTYESLGPFDNFIPAFYFLAPPCAACHAVHPPPPSPLLPPQKLIVRSLPSNISASAPMPPPHQHANANNPTTLPCKSSAVPQPLLSQQCPNADGPPPTPQHC